MTLTVNNLSKAYGNNQVIQDFNFNIHPGEIVILLGESGTGKTTFMRIINNLEDADRGTIEIDGKSLCRDNGQEAVYTERSDRRLYQNSLGMVFQDYQLFPNFTVLENLMEAPMAQKLGSQEDIKERALKLLDQMGIPDKADMYPRTLSGGQQQRVAIARALMLEPKVMCFDEPTSALDAETAKRVGSLIQGIADEGKAVLIVTHDQDFGQKYGTRIVSSQWFVEKD